MQPQDLFHLLTNGFYRVERITGILRDQADAHSAQAVQAFIRRIVLNGEVISDWSDKRLNRLRGVSISLVPQDPGNSLNPVKTIGQQVEEILRG